MGVIDTIGADPAILLRRFTAVVCLCGKRLPKDLCLHGVHVGPHVVDDGFEPLVFIAQIHLAASVGGARVFVFPGGQGGSEGVGRGGITPLVVMMSPISMVGRKNV